MKFLLILSINTSVKSIGMIKNTELSIEAHDAMHCATYLILSRAICAEQQLSVIWYMTSDFKSANNYLFT